MISVESFAAHLLKRVRFFAGVPDSTLNDLCSCLADASAKEGRYLITANEGGAVALATGHSLATGELACVFMQNSGLCNALNPLLSINDSLVYNIPIFMIIGWRGYPGEMDEPQHKKQGLITEKLLKACDIPCATLSSDEGKAFREVDAALEMVAHGSTAALLVRKKTFSKYISPGTAGESFALAREDAIGKIIQTLPADSLYISSTGMISRELFEIREKTNTGHLRDFLIVGAMGHASQIALGIARARPDRKVVCLDGDGAFIMHMGGIGFIGSSGVQNFMHVVLDNEAHASVGGQPTVSGAMDFVAIAKASGYDEAAEVRNGGDLTRCLGLFAEREGCFLLRIKVSKQSRSDLGRPTLSPGSGLELFRSNF